MIAKRGSQRKVKWDPAKHPRNPGGRFALAGRIMSGKSDSAQSGEALGNMVGRARSKARGAVDRTTKAAQRRFGKKQSSPTKDTGGPSIGDSLRGLGRSITEARVGVFEDGKPRYVTTQNGATVISTEKPNGPHMRVEKNPTKKGYTRMVQVGAPKARKRR